VSGYPDRRYFARIADTTGFRADPLETVFRLAELLSRIDARFGNELSLRGGTALNLLHLDMPRLSVDIDLDFVGVADADGAEERRPGLLAELEDLARAAGYEPAPERASYAMAHLRLPYTDANSRPAQLKLDVNFLDRVPVLPPERRRVRHPFAGDLPASEMLTFALPELAAAKTIALVRRGLARDLFDVAMLSELAGIDEQLLRTALIVRGAGYPPPSPLDYSPDVVDRVRQVRWRSEVLALVRRPVPISLDAARERARTLLRRAVTFESREREFVEQIEQGELRPELLVPDQVRDRIAINPALLWRFASGAETLEER
jgi:predicted nucleotidyltransferase component of viral defense system